MTIVLLRIFLQVEKRVEHLTRILSRCLSIPMRCRLNIDMKIIRPVKFSGVSPNLNSNSWTLWLSCNVVNPGKMFHSNSIGSPSILSKVLYSGELLNPRQSFFPCCVCARVLVHLSKTQYRIWKYVDFCALKIDDLLITNQGQILPWRVFPVNCLHSIDLIWLFGHQFLRYVEHLFHCEIFWILDGMPIVWTILHHEYRCLQCWRHEHSTYHRMFFAVFCCIYWGSFLPFSHLIIHRARMIWMLTTNLILFRRLQWRIDALLLEGKQRVSPFYRDFLLLPKWRSDIHEWNVFEGKQRVSRSIIHHFPWEDQVLSIFHSE